jgi:hypothetical protein
MLPVCSTRTRFRQFVFIDLYKLSRVSERAPVATADLIAFGRLPANSCLRAMHRGDDLVCLTNLDEPPDKTE